MKKFRCGKCGYIFEGDLDYCPSCKTKMHYHFKEEAEKEENLYEDEKVFHFDDDDVHNTGFKEIETEQKAMQNLAKSNVEDGMPSYFDGNTFQRIGWTILATLLTFVTAFIGLPWSVCMIKRWKTKHTVVNGLRLKFTGKGIQLFGRYLLWVLLSILTVGIFLFFLVNRIAMWTAKHTVVDLDKLEA